MNTTSSYRKKNSRETSYSAELYAWRNAVRAGNQHLATKLHDDWMRKHGLGYRWAK
jgi:hypothetical protein